MPFALRELKGTGYQNPLKALYNGSSFPAMNDFSKLFIGSSLTVIVNELSKFKHNGQTVM
jgi:hypothetical protein